MPMEREEGTTRGSLTPEDATERNSPHLEEDTMAIPEPPPLPPKKPKTGRHLELVPDPQEPAKATWPFAEEDPSSVVLPRRRTLSRRPPSRATSSPHLGKGRRGQPTIGGHLDKFPLPPPTEFGDANPNIRREESVIAEAQFVKNDALFQARRYARRASSIVADHGYRFASTIGERSVAAIKRFEALPRKKQILWVFAPYLVAAVLVLLLLQLRSGEPRAATAPAANPPAAAAVADVRAPEAVEDPPLIAPRPLPPPAAKTAVAKTDVAKTDEVGSPDVGAGIPRTLPRRTRLLSRPEPGRHSARLRKGAEVTVFPDFPAPDGFVLAQSSKGTVGFLSVLHLEGQSDPALDKRKKRRRRRR